MRHLSGTNKNKMLLDLKLPGTNRVVNKLQFEAKMHFYELPIAFLDVHKSSFRAQNRTFMTLQVDSILACTFMTL